MAKSKNIGQIANNVKEALQMFGATDFGVRYFTKPKRGLYLTDKNGRQLIDLGSIPCSICLDNLQYDTYNSLQ